MSRFVPTLKALWCVAKQHGCYRDLRCLLLHTTRKLQFAHETQQLIQQRESCHNVAARVPLPLCLLMRQIRNDVDYFQNVETDEHEKDLRLRRIPLKPDTTRNRNMWAWIYLPPQNTFFE